MLFLKTPYIYKAVPDYILAETLSLFRISSYISIYIHE